MSRFDAEEEVVTGRVTEAVTGRVIAEDYGLRIVGRMANCRGHLAFSAEGSPFREAGTYHLVTPEGRRIVFNVFEGNIEAWEGIVHSDEPAPGA